MDWNECKKLRITKDVSIDLHRIKSIKCIANEKIESANILPRGHYVAKITLLYDALREILESIALEKGYKIYNHECYTPFIKEILVKSSLGDNFDKVRKIRNRINYYGKKVDDGEAQHIIELLIKLIDTFKIISKNI